MTRSAFEDLAHDLTGIQGRHAAAADATATRPHRRRGHRMGRRSTDSMAASDAEEVDDDDDDDDVSDDIPQVEISKVKLSGIPGPASSGGHVSDVVDDEPSLSSRSSSPAPLNTSWVPDAFIVPHLPAAAAAEDTAETVAWNLQQVLHHLSMTAYLPALQAQHISVTDLLFLNEHDWIALFPLLGPRRRLQAFVMREHAVLSRFLNAF